MFLYRLAALGFFSALFQGMDVSWASVEEWYHRIRGHLRSKPKWPSERERTFVGLPEGGSSISVETALNSRCTSDRDGDPKIFHWGMFDPSKRLRPEDALFIMESARIPHITSSGAYVIASGNELTFRIEGASGGIKREQLMIESGMQQQAVCLSCAALGAGMVFHGMGMEGTKAPDGDVDTVRIEIDAMQPSYGNSFWTADVPGDPWVKGNLSNPVRQGQRSLLNLLSGIKPDYSGHAAVTDEIIGQVLWAARGRTPHLYKSRHCGLTIPTAQGKQNISGVFLLRSDRLFEYLNQFKDKPTHALEYRNEVNTKTRQSIQHEFSSSTTLVIFVRNEASARAFWEIGYQLLNAALQATALDVSYQAILLNEAQRTRIESIGIRTPVAVLALR